MGSPKLTFSERQQIEDLLKKLVPKKEIAKRLNRAVSTICYEIMKNSAPYSAEEAQSRTMVMRSKSLGGKHAVAPEILESIMKLRNENVGIRTIGIKFGFSYTKVYRLLRDQGLLDSFSNSELKVKTLEERVEALEMQTSLLGELIKGRFS